MCTKISPGFIIKASVEEILVISLLRLKMFLSVEIKFWKTSSRIIFKNLESFQGKLEVNFKVNWKFKVNSMVEFRSS